MTFVSRFLLSIVALAVSTHAHDVIKGKYKSYYQGHTKTSPLKLILFQISYRSYFVQSKPSSLKIFITRRVLIRAVNMWLTWTHAKEQLPIYKSISPAVWLKIRHIWISFHKLNPKAVLRVTRIGDTLSYSINIKMDVRALTHFVYVFKIIMRIRQWNSEKLQQERGWEIFLSTYLCINDTHMILFE